MIIAIHIMYSTGEWLTSQLRFSISLSFCFSLIYFSFFSVSLSVFTDFSYRFLSLSCCFVNLFFRVFCLILFYPLFLSFYTFFYLHLYILSFYILYTFAIFIFTVFLASELENTLKFDDDDSNGVQNGRLSQVSTWATHVIIIHHLNKNLSRK